MRVFLTGATGFVGQYVVRALLDAGHEVCCLIRDVPGKHLLEHDRVTTIRGDILDPLESYMKGCQGVIHLVGIIREDRRNQTTFARLHAEATAHVVNEANKAGVSNLVYVSANGASAEGLTKYQTSKWVAEEAVRNSGLDHWSILRPGLIFGDPRLARDEFCSLLARQLIRPLPVIPVFGDGQYAFQPVYVGHVAEAVVQALESKQAAQSTIVAVGSVRLTYVELIDMISRGMGLRPKSKAYIPVGLIAPLLRVMGNALPITIEQLTMLLEGNCGDAEAFMTAFSLNEHKFSEENLAYLANQG